ncbi:MAG: hypothetical protein E7435_01165 [Ruminococcaceae bacterium]|nr:hypothetical protein [Oscillospiraceae bacterium]
MTEIKLISLCLENFKCHRHLRLDFNGRNTEISGDNASGKTSVFDAFMWVLFSKSSTGIGDKNFEVKPLDKDGNVIDHDALTSVEVVLEINGEKLTLLRTYREKWETRRGSSETVFTGNTSEYYIDGVPVKHNAFQDKVNELVSEDTFRMLTNTTHFAWDIPWQERRAVLFKVAGVMDDAQILATCEGFAPLVESMGKLSLEDYKKKLLTEKKKFVGAKTEIPARISECQKTIKDIQDLDFAGAQAEVEVLNAKKEAISAQIVALEHSSEADKKALEIREAELELSTLESENRAYRTSQSSGLLNVQNLKMDLSDLRKRLDRKQHELANEQAYIDGLNKSITQYRDRWISVNGETFIGGNCPTCGQNLPSVQLQTAKAQFENDKQKRLADILQTANSYKESKAQAEERLAGHQEEIGQLEAGIRQKEQDIAAAEASLVEIVDMADYAQRKSDIQARIDKLNDELYEINHSVSGLKMRLRQEMSEINGQIGVKMGIISTQNMLEYSRKRIEELREDAKNSAECLEAIEKMLFLMDEYSRYKTRFVEDSINGLFRIARFRLFREQANGGVEDRCDVAYDGVVYENLNNGMKINLGIDIINTLSQAYGVRVPLFVDNAESVTQLEKCGSQIIRLVVCEKDKGLRVSYENS